MTEKKRKEKELDGSDQDGGALTRARRWRKHQQILGRTGKFSFGKGGKEWDEDHWRANGATRS